MKITKRQLKKIIREEYARRAARVHSINESAFDDVWLDCVEQLEAMASKNGYVCCHCAGQVYKQLFGEEADMETCVSLIQDCISAGILMPRRHPDPKMRDITVYGPTPPRGTIYE